jgi:hypothetical protein
MPARRSVNLAVWAHPQGVSQKKTGGPHHSAAVGDPDPTRRSFNPRSCDGSGDLSGGFQLPGRCIALLHDGHAGGLGLLDPVIQAPFAVKHDADEHAADRQPGQHGALRRVEPAQGASVPHPQFTAWRSGDRAVAPDFLGVSARRSYEELRATLGRACTR